MHDIRHMFITLATGFALLVIMVGSAVGLTYAMDYNPAITIALVALYGVVRMSQTCINNPQHSIRGWWITFWSNNELYKLVLLITGLSLFMI